MLLAGAGCKGFRCEPVEARGWALGVVVYRPCFNRPPGAGQIAEQVLVEAFVAEPTAEAFDNPFCCGLPGAM